MKNNKCFLLMALSMLAISSLAGCGSTDKPSSQSTEESATSSVSISSEATSSSEISSSTEISSSSIEEESLSEETSSSESSSVVSSHSSSQTIDDKPIEIGDIVKEWTDPFEIEEPPMSASGVEDSVEVEESFGNEDHYCLRLNFTPVSNKRYVGTDAVSDPYFTEDDVKNGDIISVSFYVSSDSNISSMQLEVLPSTMNNGIKSDLIEIDESTLDEWITTSITYDTLTTLGAIRLNFTQIDENQPVDFYVDDINIVLGEEVVENSYEFNDESLYQTYEEFFKVGACMSSSMLQNTKLRQIAKDNFNSLTAENEGKPEQILDRNACQALLANDPAGVAITTKPFEKIYDFCEANDIQVRHHTFVWYSQTPGWFFTRDYTDNGTKASRDLMLKRMENFIKVTLETINDRWPGLVYAIDVANEAVDNGAVRNNNNNWYSTVGDDFVYYAFLYADKYKDEDQKLYYNDYSFDYQTSNCEFALNTLLKDAIEEGLVDGVGIQGHIDSNSNLEVVMNDARMIYEKGLECQITELDITTNNTNEEGLNAQKKAYKDLIIKVLNANWHDETNITGVIVWGITDNNSWKSYQNPLLFNRDYGKKPAYYGFLEAIDESDIYL